MDAPDRRPDRDDAVRGGRVEIGIIRMLIDPAISLAAALPLAALLAAAAWHKARDFRRFAAAIDAYQLLPKGAGKVAAPSLIAAETGAALFLLSPASRFEAGIAAAALFAAYGAAIAFNLALGRRDIDCGCQFGKGASRISGGLIVRNAVLTAAGLIAAAPAAARPLGVFDLVAIGLAAAAAAALYAGFETVNANASLAARGARTT
ncbi:MAG TPA: methylamine utilization protein MauE [Parvularcula sp.]|nr:methylamine utilization protein MauE [Parvularcula sp.]